MFSKADDPNVPMAPTPAIEGVDHNGLVVGKWKNGLFGSCYMNCVPNAITPLFCPGISMAQICARLGIANFFAVLFSYFTLAVILGALVMLFTIRIRFRMRYLFSIRGSLVEDIFSSVFCCCCAVAQMADHSESFEPNTFAILPRATLPGYTFG
ncbi:uncharacterized protein PITG_12039 [Phytophthora infestans T30-4]|uniref:PLAC8 family protein n=1 Tax=Phytophthora infestans (strain T30-4) TaxID=403677 RepID=D0NHS3_PHYIT|nr:uncharacterized protein PITG_12039 [Phytophthora infestans T30-4]EEY58998.1 conserved hypothetical protein [Phytophthora infestans T30-4]|eukprot:XP_002901471.1 conserved hypothetical protein [Phytophthora infestans T30-4]